MSAFSIGLREGLEAAVLVAAMATLVRGPACPRPLARYRWWIGSALMAGIVSGLVLFRSARSASAVTMQVVELAVAAGAAVVLASAFLAVGRRLRSDLGAAGRPAARVPPEIVVGAIAVWRETVEATLFVAAGHGRDSATAVVALDLLAGAALGVVIVVGATMVLQWRLTSWHLLAVDQAMLGLFATGMVMQALRSASSLGWLRLGGRELIELGWLEAPGAQVLHACASLVGVVPGMSLSEGLTWVALVAVVAAAVGRSWGTASWAGSRL